MKKINKRFAYKNNITNESLPYPITIYPIFSGTFIAFQENEITAIALCHCYKKGLENYLKIRTTLKEEQSIFSDKRKMFILSSNDFPFQLVELLISQRIKSDYNVLNYIPFVDNLCHKCQNKTPSIQYCSSMYGGTFIQKHGWYINLKHYEFGLSRYNDIVIKECCPIEIQELSIIKRQEYNELRLELMNKDITEMRLLEKRFTKQHRQINNVIENIVREEFNYKKIGDSWISETILYKIIKSLFPQKKVKRHHRPKYLQGLELDVYIEEIKLAIEYQGIQHYKAIKHWGGETALEELKKRDKKKKLLCKQLNIDLICFKYDEPLEELYIIEKLKKYL